LLLRKSLPTFREKITEQTIETSRTRREPGGPSAWKESTPCPRFAAIDASHTARPFTAMCDQRPRPQAKGGDHLYLFICRVVHVCFAQSKSTSALPFRPLIASSQAACKLSARLHSLPPDCAFDTSRQPAYVPPWASVTRSLRLCPLSQLRRPR